MQSPWIYRAVPSCNGLPLHCVIRPFQVYTEIMSFLKGSAEAVSFGSGLLSLEQYLDMGNKKAPNFTKERRQQV